jgi:hypothetical protein
MISNRNLTLSQACSFLRNIVRESVELQFNMQLGISQMVCTKPLSEEPSSLSIRLEVLKQRERAWRYAKWDESFEFDYPELARGAIMNEYRGSVYSHGDDPGQSISFVQFPPSPDPEYPIQWMHSFNPSVCEYATDATQDLLILVVPSPIG